MRTVAKFTCSRVSLKFRTEQSTEQIILALESGMVQDIHGIEDATIVESTTTRLTNREPRGDDYRGESLVSDVRFPAYRGQRP
jgi:hypothetical protein